LSNLFLNRFVEGLGGDIELGKMVSVYLTDGEADDLRRFCESHGCTQYSALKTALHELLSKPIEVKEKEDDKDQLEIDEQAKNVEKDETEELSTEKGQALSKLWKYLSKPN